jgi:hypothetical protein
MADTRFIYFAIPTDTEFLKAIGAVSICHAHLDHMLRMTVKTLAELSVDDALDATERTPSVVLRERVHKLARQRLGEGPPLLKLEALLERCRRATGRRNELIHNVVGHELDREPVMRREGNVWGPIPTVEELRALATELQNLAGELNDARLHTWLAEALKSKPLK